MVLLVYFLFESHKEDLTAKLKVLNAKHAKNYARFAKALRNNIRNKT
jgi:hypothetical protein